MKNIPVFTAANGVASLILQEIPISGLAYVLVRSVWTDVETLLDECRGFCRAAGAERVFASWEENDLPGTHAYDLWAMSREKTGLPAPRRPQDLVPLTPEYAQDYLDIYNTCFRTVPAAATYFERDLKRLYDQDCAFLVREGAAFAAVAEISQTGLEAIAVLPQYRGLGFDLAATVLPMVPSVALRLKVASTNGPALALYDRLGFQREGIVRKWFQIF